MKLSHRYFAAGLAALLLIMTGCSHDQFPSYSSSLKYPPRKDPIPMQPGAKLGDERYEPDTPGQLPLVNIEGIFVEGSPYRKQVMLTLEPKVVNAIMIEMNPDLMKKGDAAKDEIEALRTKVTEQVSRDPIKYLKYFTQQGLDGTLRDPAKLVDQKDLDDALEATFGSPASPKVAGLDAETVNILKIDDATLAKGSTRYRVHCLHCHGVSGDGRGPTAKWINPHPRDFRAGLFKFQSINQLESKPGAAVAHSNGARPPSRADLLRTLRHGIEGTAMPSFGILPDEELELIASYVIHLSIRGHVERDLLKEYCIFDAATGKLTLKVDEEDEDTPKTIAATVKLLTVSIAEKSYATKFNPKADTSWRFSQNPALAIVPGEYNVKDVKDLKESIKRGKYLFTGDEKNLPGAKNAACVTCHVDYGRQAKYRFDDWATLVRPNNFTQGVFRGGRRPIDLYYRIHSGINGSGMANYGGSLSSDQIWDLVNFVSEGLPYPAMHKGLDIK